MKNRNSFYFPLLILLAICGCAKVVSLDEIHAKKYDNLDQYLQTICKGTPKIIRTVLGNFEINDAERIVNERYIQYKIKTSSKNPEKYLSFILNDYYSSNGNDYTANNQHTLILGDWHTFVKIPMLNKKYQVYLQLLKKEKLPKFYKNKFISMFKRNLMKQLYKRISCYSAKQNNKYIFYECQYGICYISLSQEEIKSKLDDIFRTIYNKIKKQINAFVKLDKKIKWWKGINLTSNRYVILKNVKVQKDWYNQKRYTVEFTIINKSNFPYTFDLTKIILIKNQYQFPVFFQIDVNTKEILQISVSGSAERIFGNKVVIPPGGKCKIKYNDLKIVGLSSLDNTMLVINDLSAILKHTNQYKEKVDLQ